MNEEILNLVTSLHGSREKQSVGVEDTHLVDTRANDMTSSECPLSHTCNASLCPLGQTPSEIGWHAPGEQVCYYLRMSGKAGAAERFADDPAFAECVERLPSIVAEYPSIGRAVAQASKSGFPSAHLLKRNTPAKAVSSRASLGGCPSQVV